MKLRGLIMAGLLFCGMANASETGEALAQTSVCLRCHQVDQKRVGPSFRDIAIRYAGNVAAIDYLARSIREGSRGAWSVIPMPAQRHVNEANARKLAEWIVSLAPAEEDTNELSAGGGAGTPGTASKRDLIGAGTTGETP